MSTADSSLTPISIAFCITGLEVGGAERCLAQLATRLDGRRYRKAVYALGPWPQPGESSLAASLMAAGVQVECLGLDSVVDLPVAIRRLARALRRQRPQLVQTFLFHANIVGRIAARLAGVPRVVSGIRVAERRQGWRLAVDRWTTRLVNEHVCVSEDVARFSREVGRLPAEQIVVIPNGVDIERHRQASPLELSLLGLPTGRKAIAYVGRLDAQKRVDWLLDLAPDLLARLRDYDLLIVGQGAQRPRLEQQARQLGIGDRVHFAGWRPDVPEILKASSLVVLASAWEGMPNVILEAMASGRPVVATDVEGVRELLGPNCEPQVAPIDSPQVFIEKSVAIIRTAGMADQIGAQNFARAQNCFSLDAMVAAYDRLYRSLLER